MSRVVVIGATGHIGTYLVPRLVDGGHEVIAVSRGTRGPYHASPQWDAVTRVTADREAEDADGRFADRVAELRPEVVIDLICFTPVSAQRLVEALLNQETRAGGVPTVVLHAGHISGPGWPAITPAGNLDPAAWTHLAAGVARWFGREPALDFVSWDEFTRRAGPEHAEVTREHAFRSITASIARAREVLGYAPRYSSLDALHEALAWLVDNGQADAGGQQAVEPPHPAGRRPPPGGPET
jgi:nucleoside-diphosphate-sugar epimerase